MMLVNKIKDLLLEIDRTLSEQEETSRLSDNTYYLSDGNILCCPRKYGESRFPYSCDGCTIWAHSTGYIYAKEGVFNVFKPVHDEAEPPIGFWAGIKQKNGEYFPISILGGAEQLFEPYQTKRYLVYSYAAAYYIADTEFATFAVRTDMSNKKEMRFSVLCINKKNEILQLALTTYFEAFLKNGVWDDMFSKTDRTSKYIGNGSFLLERQGWDYHALSINRKITGTEVTKSYHTTSKTDFLGYTNRRVNSAECLKTGIFERQIECVGKETSPIAAEILHINVEDHARIDFVLPIQNLILHEIDIQEIDKEIEKTQNTEKERIGNLKIKFDEWNYGKINAPVLNNFLFNVQKQVDFCAMGKSYVDALLGVRDVFQQLEQALIWDPSQARDKIVRALGYIDPSGRSPRQFSIPEHPDATPEMDLREFIDQGNWIISCVYSYLAWTNDFSILDEVCGYYEIIEERTVKRSELKGSVLEHILRIADYLVSNIDKEDGTNCLRILFGDWNDALDGLGRTYEPGKVYGTGVSVMASLHFYQNLSEITEILKYVHGYDDKIKQYIKIQKELGEGLQKYAVERNKEGELRLIHGWGDHNSYRIGSFCDSDGKSRISFAPNAFWATSGLIQSTPEFKQLIIDTLHKLDSRFGLKTLIPSFAPDAPGVGRLATILPGTAENECVYCHASMFSIMALFALGDAEYAWKQLEKVLPITHEYITRSPFVMSNSYLDNPEMGLNGESAIDWYTGGGTVLLKNLIKYGFGILPDLNGVVIQTASKMPCNSVCVDMYIKGVKVQYIYENRHIGQRCIYLNDKKLETFYDSLMQTEKAYICNDALQDGVRIVVCD